MVTGFWHILYSVANNWACRDELHAIVKFSKAWTEVISYHVNSHSITCLFTYYTWWTDVNVQIHSSLEWFAASAKDIWSYITRVDIGGKTLLTYKPLLEKLESRKKLAIREPIGTELKWYFLHCSKLTQFAVLTDDDTYCLWAKITHPFSKDFSDTCDVENTLCSCRACNLGWQTWWWGYFAMMLDCNRRFKARLIWRLWNITQASSSDLPSFCHW